MKPPLRSCSIQNDYHTEITHLPLSIHMPISVCKFVTGRKYQADLRTLMGGVGGPRQFENNVDQGRRLGDLPVYPSPISLV